ncbi:S-type pyocin domain-containing protein [Pseudomonas aeruginosa]|nr:S-type pyocin domain-containing protein [Pseudomonas aeruginosa]
MSQSFDAFEDNAIGVYQKLRATLDSQHKAAASNIDKDINKKIDSAIQKAGGNKLSPLQRLDITISTLKSLINQRTSQLQSEKTRLASLPEPSYTKRNDLDFVKMLYEAEPDNRKLFKMSLEPFVISESNGLAAEYNIDISNKYIANLNSRLPPLEKSRPAAIKATDTFSMPAIPVGVNTAPILSVPGGKGAVSPTAGSPSLGNALKKAVSSLAKDAIAKAGQVAAVFATLAASSLLPKLSNGERQFSTAIPVSELNPPKTVNWQAVAAAKGTVDLPYRVQTIESNGKTQIVVAPTEGLLSKVPVRALVRDPKTGAYSYTEAGPRGISITVTPANAPGSQNPSTTTPANPVPPLIFPGPTVTAIEPQIETYPDLGERDFNDAIYVYPSETGLPPVYIAFKDARDEPGVGTGKGQPVAGNWLAGASQGNGAPIPTQIANQLRGKDFKSWRDFREQFWIAVSNDPELIKQFNFGNKSAIKAGYAPYAIPSEQVGGREKFELHHVIPIAGKGAIYDIDNIRVMTPKRHIEVHTKK